MKLTLRTTGTSFHVPREVGEFLLVLTDHLERSVRANPHPGYVGDPPDDDDEQDADDGDVGDYDSVRGMKAKLAYVQKKLKQPGLTPDLERAFRDELRKVTAALKKVLQ